VKPTLEWQVAGACNYDCSYCIQSVRSRRGRPGGEQLELALAFFEGLEGSWEIKCSGGEAFAHPLFLDQIVPGLMERTPHRISVLTNLSASHHDLQRFVELTRGRLEVFSASLHLEFVSLEAFADKASWLVGLLEPEVDFVVNQVVFPGRLDEAQRCRDELEDRGLRWFAQLYKREGGVAEYDAQTLGRLIGRRPANRSPSFQGRRCHAGVRYAAIDKDGSVWSCRTAKRVGEGRLGNVLDGSARLWEEPRVCPYTICPCTVPRNRGMIEGLA
jgi:MoaA/NifB/PqqE/SkfB family radical SAM enzyme